MSRLLPCLDDPSPPSFTDNLAAIRTWLELLTDSNPYTQIDWTTYQTIHAYLTFDPLSKKSSGGVSRLLDQAALIMAQALPPTSLIDSEDDIKPLARPTKDQAYSHIHAIAQFVLDGITKAKADKEKADAEARWKAWCDIYGYPTNYAQLPPLPKEMEWGMWGLMWVDPNEWWTKPAA
ncbi:hypothetical protein BD324DRAFT_652005 [Kockovaella imperatae]|uniref:Uncharacterized protein n=1 Tax=Kockovaella imperatae TaxID=4999 RepID=A0A1Y1UDJ4_9TREE|nr:hypothetical protein BD324DRAFT_652005 [Kockovaella imperatae]ORX36101.1 hypothetical protein BD324DRAFT_652005 [Kockovaella imperatae]